MYLLKGDCIDEKSSWSWYDEVKKRRESIMDKPMTFYRGNEKTGTQVFEEADMLAKALMAKGITKGDNIMACMSNVPEVLLLRSSHIQPVHDCDRLVESQKEQIFLLPLRLT